MQYEYKTKGTCSQRILFEITDGKVCNVDLVSQKEELIKLYEDDRVLKQYGIAKKRVEDSQFN